mgnify:CR=1 FL=1
MELNLKDFEKEEQALAEELIRVNAEYELWQEQVAELDLELSKEYKNRQKKVTGGLIEGKEEVPFTKENPADRINKFTFSSDASLAKIGRSG